MSTNNWADFGWWRERYEANDVGLDDPFVDEPWSPDTTFLWAKTIEPVGPGLGSPSGFWSVFPHPRAVAGALRFVLLPDWFGAWLGRDDWDPEPEAFRPAEDLLAESELRAPDEPRADLALMRELLAELDALLAIDDAAAIAEGLTRVEDKLNGRWHGTGSWDFFLESFHGPAKVADELIARRTEYLGEGATDAQAAEALGMPRTAWRELCVEAIDDEDARETVLDALEDDSF